MAIKLILSVEVNPTEDEEKIINSLSKLFKINPSKIKERKIGNNKMLIYETTDFSHMETFSTKIKQRNIQSHVKAYLERNIIGNKTHLFINKQVAVVGKVSLCDSPDECPLGAIVIEIEAETPDELRDIINAIVK